MVLDSEEEDELMRENKILRILHNQGVGPNPPQVLAKLRLVFSSGLELKGSFTFFISK